MIDCLYIHDTTRQVIDIIDVYESIIWDNYYFTVGKFEIYTPLTDQSLNDLKIGYYVTRPDRPNDAGIIEKCEITYTAGGMFMITASGRFVKSILDRRLIYDLSGNTVNPVIMRGNVETVARNLVNISAINATDTARNIPFLKLGTVAGLTAKIIDNAGHAAQKQTSYGNLLEVTDDLLKEYNYGAYINIDQDTQNLVYNVFEGIDRTLNSVNPLIFSQEYDNLLSSDYILNTQNLKTAVLIGGEGQGVNRKYLMLAGDQTGINRREIFVDGSNNSQTYTDGNNAQQSYSDSEYLSMLNTAALESLTKHTITENFDGEIDLTNSGLKYGVDYSIGDAITIIDNTLGITQNARIAEVTEVQDDDGYKINVTFSKTGA